MSPLWGEKQEILQIFVGFYTHTHSPIMEKFGVQEWTYSLLRRRCR